MNIKSNYMKASVTKHAPDLGNAPQLVCTTSICVFKQPLSIHHGHMIELIEKLVNCAGNEH